MKTEIDREVPLRDLRVAGLLWGGAALVAYWYFGRARIEMVGASVFSVSLLLFFLIVVFVPKLLRRPYGVWMMFSSMLGKMNNFLILSLLFVVIFTPVGLLFRLVQLIRSGNKKEMAHYVRYEEEDDELDFENPF